MLILKVNNVHTQIFGLSASEYRNLERHLSFRPKDYQFTSAFNRWIYDRKTGKRIRRFWDGWKRQCWSNQKGVRFPTGLMSLALAYLKGKGFETRIQDLRIKPEPSIKLTLSDKFQNRDYQQGIINISCSRSRGVIEAATGSGKTSMAGGIIQKIGVTPVVFYVTSIDLLEQAKEDLESILLLDGKPIEVGQIGGGVIEIRDINVMTIQTAVRALDKVWNKDTKFDSEDTDDKTPIEKHKKEIKNLIRTAKLSICDEVQHWRANTCQEVAKAMRNAYYTYGMSATPYRDEGDDMMIMACFGRKIGEITASELIKDGWLIKPEIKMIHVRDKPSKYKQWQSIYKDQIVENVLYNAYVANITNAYIKQGRIVLVLVQQIKHGQYLQSVIPGSVFVSGKSSKVVRRKKLNELRNKEISCIISTTIFDEGIDVRPLDTVVLAGGGKSRVRAMQRIGRIIRPFEDKNGKKTTATAIDFCLHQKYLEKHAIERMKMYNSEPEYQVDEIDPT